jgi:Bifunctional DNA primase/polymerase, N-terminal
MSDLADAAAGYCEAGWSIVPCRVTGKRALVRWKPWQQAPADAEQLAIWWRRWPKANLAVITGRVSGIVVVDVDPRHGGDRALAGLEREHGDLPWRAVVETPSGGWHVYLRHPGGRVPNSAGRLGVGVDVRGDGGLALLPPSRRHGDAYRWAVGGPAAVPEMPAAWVELLRPRPRRGRAQAPMLGHGGHQEARLAGLLRVLERAPEGRRNATLYWAGRRLAEMVDQGAPGHWREVLEQAGVAAGLPAAEVRATIASALDGGEP